MNSLYLNSALAARAREPEALIVHPHTQRTGGNTIRRKVLETVYGRTGVYNQFNVAGAKKWPELTDADLAGCRAFTAHFDFTANAVARPVFPLAVLRDPVYRAVSLYNFIRGKEGHRHHALAVALPMEEFYLQASAQTPSYFRELQCRRICGSPDARMAIETVNAQYLGVGFTETLGLFVEALARALGWPRLAIDSSPPDSERYAGAVTPRFRAMVLDDNPEDLALFECLSRSAPPFRLHRPIAREASTILQRTRKLLRPVAHRLRRVGARPS